MASVVTSSTISTTSASAERDVDDVRAGSMIGLPDMRPSSFRKAMTEPVKVIAPMATPSAISTSAWP
jgi:hypothetical protein